MEFQQKKMYKSVMTLLYFLGRNTLNFFLAVLDVLIFSSFSLYHLVWPGGLDGTTYKNQPKETPVAIAKSDLRNPQGRPAGDGREAGD